MAGHVPASCARGVALVHSVLNIPVLRWSWVLRYDQVSEVLSHDEEFPVPWTDKMKGLTSQENFVLGMPRDNGKHTATPTSSLPRRFRAKMYRRTSRLWLCRRPEEILADKYDGRKFDAIQEVITAVPARMCESYYGIPIPQSETALFGKASLAISRYVFVPDTSDSDNALAEAGSGKARERKDTRCDRSGA